MGITQILITLAIFPNKYTVLVRPLFPPREIILDHKPRMSQHFLQILAHERKTSLLFSKLLERKMNLLFLKTHQEYNNLKAKDKTTPPAVAHRGMAINFVFQF